MATVAGLAADAVVVLHLGWILFLIFGALIGRRVRWVRWLHLGGLGFAGVLTARGGICPLTHLEGWLRGRAGGSAYVGTFLGHYAERLVYLEVSRETVLLGLLVVVLGSAAAYGWPRPGGKGKRRPRKAKK